MIQDIEPLKYDIAYRRVEAEAADYVLLFSGEKILVKYGEKGRSASEFLTFAELESMGMSMKELKPTYLFAIDDHKYFLVNLDSGELEAGRREEDLTKMAEALKEASISLTWLEQPDFRTLVEKWRCFAGISAIQINRWYRNHKFCGSCGSLMEHSPVERALVCPQCGITEYPKISPAVIVGIVDGDRLLLTRYADRPFKKYALIAGFSEVGESLEDTVRREVMEEVGLKVKEITYYKSQPWSFSDSLLAGFFAKLEGSDTVVLEDGELAEGTWFNREDIPINEEKIALTAEMIRFFAEGNTVFKE